MDEVEDRGRQADENIHMLESLLREHMRESHVEGKLVEETSVKRERLLATVSRGVWDAAAEAACRDYVKIRRQAGSTDNEIRRDLVSLGLSKRGAREATRLAETTERSSVPVPFRYAGFWRRTWAFIIDSIVWLLLMGLCGLGVEVLLDLAALLHLPVDLLLPAVLLLVVCGLLYFPVMESLRWQGTLGKKAMGIIVVDLAGKRVSFWRALLRNLARPLSAFLFAGYLMAAYTRQKQGLHDMIADCLVICRPSKNQ